MFKEFLSAITEKITDFLIENPNFFQEDDRAAILEKKLKLPSSFTQYLTEVKEKEFLADLKLTLSYTKNAKDLNIKKSKLFKALVHFLTGDLARKIDLLDNDYYLYQVSDRKKIVDKLINSESKLAQTIKNILLNQTYQQVSSEIYQLSSKVKQTPYTLVQSPREIPSELKKEIRENLRKDNEDIYPIFQINKKLIGGIRIFQDGQSTDMSWLSRVLHFTSITSV